MNKKSLTAAVVTFVLGASSLGTAQARDDRDHRHDRRDRHEQRHDNRHDHRHDQRHDARRGPPVVVVQRSNHFDHRHDMRHDHRRGYGYDRHFQRGQRLPVAYRGQGYIVNDWRSHRLQAPPRGHQWVQVGRDQMLVAIATGVIAQLILSQ